MTKTQKLRKTGFGPALPALLAGLLISTAIQPTAVSAADETDTAEEIPVYTVSTADTTLNQALKENIITAKAEDDANINMETVDLEASELDVTGLDYTRDGLQNVTVRVKVADESENTTLGYTFIENIYITVEKSGPALLLTDDTVTVTNGDTFNAASYIASVADDLNELPALKVEGDVDTATDGTYEVTYTAVDSRGNTACKTLTVNVETPKEVLEARARAEEEARLAAEAEARAAAEAEAQAAAAAAQEQARQAASYTGYGAVSGNGANPYSGGWSNCVSGAWMIKAAQGVYLPNFGDASGWLWAAQANGYSTGSTPAVGAVAVYAHHVAVVLAVYDNGTVYIAEGGFNGGYNERVVSWYGTSTQALQGYIYC